MMVRTLALVAFVAGAPLIVLAHHSAVLFDLSKTFTVSGTITKVDWRNPHVAIFVDVKRETGDVEAWAFETGAPSWFRGRGFGKKEFESAIGQAVTVEGVRAKDGSLYGYLYRITFEDGRSVDLR
jgi:hypothetical protein